MMKKLTVFTPTYNRRELLTRLYSSLCNQTSKGFLWLIIDDGSSDQTGKLVKEWQTEGKLDIQYHYKENGGMHTGHNAAYQLINTELNVCIDSDDYMPNDAVEKIIYKWSTVIDKTKIAGIIGLDADNEGAVIGTRIPAVLDSGSLSSLYEKHNVRGDKKIILRTDIVRNYPPYPEYVGEKLVPLGILYLMICAEFDFIYSNEVYCIVEYQADGSSNSILKQYKQSPRGFGYARMIQKRYSSSLLQDLKNSTHLISSALFANDLTLLFKGGKIYQNILMIPFGLILHACILFKIR